MTQQRSPDRNNPESPAPLTNLLIAAKQKSEKILASGQASLSYATKCAKILVGYFPHARPPEPLIYADGLAHALSAYPLGIIDECCDLHMGLARKLEFPPTPKQVMDWCDERVRYHQALASYVPRLKSAPLEPVYSVHDQATMAAKLAALVSDLKSRFKRKHNWAPGPTDDELRAAYPPKPEVSE